MINLLNLTEEQKEELKKQLAEEEAQKEKKRKEKIQDYKNLVDDCVMKAIKKVQYISEMIATGKKEIQDTFKAILDLKAEVYGIKDNQQSHTFTTTDGKYTIILGHRVIDNFDDTVHSGIAKVNNYISRVVKDENKQLQDIINLLLKRDKNGNLKASRVMELEKIASEIQDEQLTEGVKIIKEAWQPMKSKTFIEAYYKDEHGNKKIIPLSVTAVMEEENENDNSSTS